MKIKLSEALLRRKELSQKVDQLRSIKDRDLYEIKVSRKAAHEGIDDIVAQVPRLAIENVTAAYDFHARQLRKVDAAIQQANWTTEIDIDESVMQDFKTEDH